ncbi:uncharacterized protein C18orf25 homolog isoform X2 [Electrophorus electricus]|uniref:E3 ubiquitin-protein ligase Arkadia N-terminal domain-containing protein n=1 Tax=Electrophorus electricus TaxID=8005 RepID=A0AAY5ENX8_ELEEL|nr:uncharacterized protein C18orf25 homolog isoform X2 [Electrophorus electricus]
MADPQKANELPECPIEGGATAEEQDMSLRPETTPTSSPTCEEPGSGQSPTRAPPPGLLSMPCLLKELRRDSSPEQPLEAVPASATAQLRPQEDSDSSICLRSPSSSGHLGDSDTLSSAEEAAEPAPAAAGRKSSRRSRSESDASGVAMAAKKNRCQERQVNGRGRGRGPRSQRQKERMRMLRQKREAAARRKPDLLQDSSTSDSDITAHSSSSSSSSSASSDNEGGAVNSHPTEGPAVIGQYDVSDTHSEQEQQQPRTLAGPVEAEPPRVGPASSDSEVEIVGVQENASAVSRFPRGGVIQSLSSWKQRAPPPWSAVNTQTGWAPPPEVVDLTLDEDRHRYLL